MRPSLFSVPRDPLEKVGMASPPTPPRAAVAFDFLSPASTGFWAVLGEDPLFALALALVLVLVLAFASAFGGMGMPLLFGKRFSRSVGVTPFS